MLFWEDKQNWQTLPIVKKKREKIQINKFENKRNISPDVTRRKGS